MNGPRCTVASAGPLGSSSLRRECLAYVSSASEPIWHVAFAPRSCGYAQIVGGTTRGYQLFSLTLRRDLAQQGRMSGPVASCSSPRVGRRTFVRISACLPVIGRTAIPARREAGASRPLQVQHRQMLRPIIMTVKFAVCEVPVLCTLINAGFQPDCDVGRRARPPRFRDSGCAPPACRCDRCPRTIRR